MGEEVGSVIEESDLVEYLGRCAAETGVPGISVAMHSGNRTISAASGKSSLLGPPLLDNARFAICSLGKVLLSFVVLQLAQEGELSIDAPIGEYLPELGGASCPKGNHIHVKHLLSHTSGYRGDDPAEKSFSQMTWGTAIEYFRHAWQLFPPGTVFSEVNLDYALLGQVVRRVTDLDPLDLVRQRILSPMAIEPGMIGNSSASSIPPVLGHEFDKMELVQHLDCPMSNEFWAPAISNFTLSTSDLVKLGRLLFHEASPPGTPGPHSDCAIRMLSDDGPIFPAVMGNTQNQNWNPVMFSNGIARFHNGSQGVFSAGRSQACALVSLNSSSVTVAIAYNARAPRIRTVILDDIVKGITNGRLSNQDMASGISQPELNFEEFLGGFTPGQLVGAYVGSSRYPVLVGVQENRLILKFGAKEKMIFSRLQRNKLVLETRSRVPVAFFAGPDKCPAIMLGMRSYKKVR